MIFSDETVMAYADGELDEATRAAVESAMATDSALADRVARERRFRARLHSEFDPVLTEPIPDQLLAAAKGTSTKARTGDIIEAHSSETLELAAVECRSGKRNPRCAHCAPAAALAERGTAQYPGWKNSCVWGLGARALGATRQRPGFGCRRVRRRQLCSAQRRLLPHLHVTRQKRSCRTCLS